MIIWWTRIFNGNVDLIFTAMNAHEIIWWTRIFIYDGLEILRRIRIWFLKPWMLMILWWTRIFNENVDLIFTEMNAHEILNYDVLKFLTSIRVWPLQQWMLMKLSDKLFHYDMLWFSKRRPTRCRHDDLNFSNFQCLSISKPEPMIPCDPVKARKMMFLNS